MCTPIYETICIELGRGSVSRTLSFIVLKCCSPELQQKFTSETITEEELVGLMNKFMEDTINGGHLKEIWLYKNVAS